ncbi:hypothetical protein K435DRAFT_667588 [Dendrothele bispora CBS 962.96]|uniref:TPR-like protein n=1 Tax=Dendrothele bispora (strain CBS 962.96) TaxID=1314807 RepID=A0A4S8LZW4_DENBC|nr:hypothetical protein K435DRAFT_667588 [Dendrothele bispora CBS 962.96]
MPSDHLESSESTGSSRTSQESLQYANEQKDEGNDHFRAQRWEEALASYRAGLGYLPKRIPSTKLPSTEDDEALENNAESSKSPQASKADDVGEAEIREDPESVKLRAVLNANIAACYVKLNDHKAAVDACTQALLDDPQYIKALQRRASSNDKLDTWSSLTAVQEDYNALLKLVPSSSNEAKDIQRSLHNLKPRLEAAQKKETGEMLDKLKGLGNSILGNFGLSTDNFKFVPNGQGGYSVDFSK